MVLDERKTLEGVAQFFTEHGRWPSALSSSGYERGMGLWLSQQRVSDAGGTMDPFRRSFLNQHLPGWDASPDDVWQDHARAVSDFILANGRTPGAGASGAGERLLAIWLSAQRALDSIGVLQFTRRGWLDGHCPGWQGETSPLLINRVSPTFALKRRPS